MIKHNTIFKAMLYLTLVLTFGYGLIADTNGKLTVSTTTSQASAVYAPRNVVAIWIEDANGNFVKTLMVYAKNYLTWLTNWKTSTKKAGSLYNSVDAITGASRNVHGKLECYWDGTDYNETQMPDGKYKVWMELTDKNATGNYSAFEFTKSSTTETQTPANVPSFSHISIAWVPDNTPVKDELKGKYTVYPNPGAGIFKVNGEDFTKVEIRDFGGKLIYQGSERTIDISDKPAGVYFIKIANGENAEVKKIVKE